MFFLSHYVIFKIKKYICYIRYTLTIKEKKKKKTAKVWEKRKTALGKQAERLQKLNEQNKIKHTTKTVNTWVFALERINKIFIE